MSSSLSSRVMFVGLVCHAIFSALDSASPVYLYAELNSLPPKYWCARPGFTISSESMCAELSTS